MAAPAASSASSSPSAIAEDIVRDCTAIRRRLHREAELSGQERNTRDLVLAELEAAGLETRTFPGSTAVVGLWPGRDRSRAIAFRADMDALPMEEASGLPWASQSVQAMHACGHDGHTGILLGLAKQLARSGRTYAADIKLLFQPAEEAGNGAKQMVLDGALESPRVEAVFGLHGWPDLPLGVIGVHGGAVMASVDNFELTLHGKGGHGAQPHATVDPVFAAAQLISAAQSLVSRSIDPLDSAVLTFAQVQAGRTFNVIPEECLLRGTVRSHHPGVRERLKAGLESLAVNLCRGLGLEARLQWVEGCPATLNDPAMAALARRAAVKAFGESNCVTPRPSMAAEDFPFFLEKAPGAYLWLGLGNARGSLHNPRFDFNDEALETGMRLFLAIIEEKMGGG
ncbi:MAG TPA: M20 family metallopeptidase [Fibrobacteria bacterium]|nr:M20 family metallopeptidase [Fibrobacteria bacterium]